MPEHTAADREDAPAPELPATLDVPGKAADFLRTAELEPAERAALDRGPHPSRGASVLSANGRIAVPARAGHVRASVAASAA
ncbi:hypothetical protein ACF1BU_34580 [Streptomyces sp. NPDC014724]|uniref:hypothetical protein n=1 Tax=unclassified Streptomyces TaxID=2593676 RepID=UPI00370048F7